MEREYCTAVSMQLELWTSPTPFSLPLGLNPSITYESVLHYSDHSTGSLNATWSPDYLLELQSVTCTKNYIYPLCYMPEIPTQNHFSLISPLHPSPSLLSPSCSFFSFCFQKSTSAVLPCRTGATIMLSRMHSNHQLFFDLQMRDIDELGDFASQMLESP